MSFSFAGTFSALISGPILRKYKDNDAVAAFTMLSIVAMLGFYFICGGETSSSVAIVYSFMIVVGTAFNYNILFLLVEFRSPPERLGSTLSLLNTMGTLAASLCPYLAYMP